MLTVFIDVKLMYKKLNNKKVMKTILFNTVKNRVIKGLDLNNPLNSDVISMVALLALKNHASHTQLEIIEKFQKGFSQSLFQEVQNIIIDIINKWDIRQVKLLITYSPKNFPLWVRNGSFTVNMNDNGQWLLIANTNK